jgi:hypothetical protein
VRNEERMADGITGIDHVVIGVRDLDAAEAAFRRLGFALTPRGRHPRFGTANHCAMFGARNYLELMAVVDPDASDDFFRACLAGRAGPAAVAWQASDARAVGQSWAAAGLAPREPIDFVRPVETDQGRRDARFCIVPLAADSLPGLMGFAIQHDTPELVWRPGSTDHPNGAQTIVALTGVADDPAALADAYGRAAGRDRVAMDGADLVVATGSAPIRFFTPARFQEEHGGIDADARPPALAALSIAVRSLDGVRKLLDGNFVPFVESGAGGVVVGPDRACGAVIAFVDR